MRKTSILLFFLFVSLLARSQDSTGYTLNNIKEYTMHLEECFPVISHYMEAGNQKAIAQQTKSMKTCIDSMEDEMEYLPDDYYYRLSSLVSLYRTEVDEFEKLILNDDFEGKDKMIASAFTNLQVRQSNLRKAIAGAYSAATTQSAVQQSEDESESASVTATKPDKRITSTDTAETTSIDSNNTIVIVETTTPDAAAASNNVLLDTIHRAQNQIEQCIGKIALAIKKNNRNMVQVCANRIENASLMISDLTLLLKTTQKESLFILANGVKTLSKKLYDLAVKSNTAPNEMLDCFAQVKIKFSSLSTGISFVR